MELSIQERLKDLRVERRLEQFEKRVNLSKSVLGSYEAKNFKDISSGQRFMAWPLSICWGCPKQKITQTPVLQTCRQSRRESAKMASRPFQ